MDYNFSTRYDGISGSAIRQIFALLGDPQMISFAGGNPSPMTFPSKALAELSRELLLNEGDTLLQYGNTAGVASYLEVILNMLREEGFSPREDEVLALTGSSQGIELMAKAFINRGDVIYTEAPTFLGAVQTFRLYEADVRGIKTDEQGMIPELLEEALKAQPAKFIYTIPTFQNPTGRSMSCERRRALVKLAEKYGTFILEDDPYALLRYSGEALPSVKSFDETGRVVRLISFSKTVSPGLRVGAAYGNAEIIKKFNMGKQGADCHTANLNQRVVAEYVRRGLFYEGVGRCCELYSGKLALMKRLCGECFPEGTQLSSPEGGMFLWAELPPKLNATELFSEAVKSKVAYVPGTHFYPQGGNNNTLRLNFTMVDEARIEKGIKTLGALLCR